MTHLQPGTSVRSRSLWLDQLGDIPAREAFAGGQEEVDVIIVGGGYTGMWTAYHLTEHRPQLRVAVLEKQVVGYGAAGRNGGWAGAGIAGNPRTYARASGWERTVAAARLMETAVDAIGEVIEKEGLRCDFVKGGTLVIATSQPQWQRLRRSYDAAVATGLAEPDSRLLDADGVRSMIRTPAVAGGLFTSHCARIQPAQLVRGLAQVCERRGVKIYENTPARAIQPGRVRTDRGTITARRVLRTTEAWTAELTRREVSYMPLTSMMIATEPLPAEVWDTIGWPQGLTVRDRRHLFFYAQRTADNRIAIGGRGAPYRLREPLAEFGERDRAVWDRLEHTMHEHFPATRGAAITHRWGGALAVPRDWSMSVQYDPGTGIGSAGGYSGHGVVASYLAGRGLADLALGQRSEFTSSPWVGHRSRRWEPEPLRYLAAGAIVRVLNGADAHEDATDRPARRVSLLGSVLPPG